MRRTLTNVLRLASVPLGVGVGLWTASLWVDTSNLRCAYLLMCAPGPRFTLWQSGLFGIGAAVAAVLLSLAIARPRSTRQLKAASKAETAGGV
jgi:hypothetical protein